MPTNSVQTLNAQLATTQEPEPQQNNGAWVGAMQIVTKHLSLHNPGKFIGVCSEAKTLYGKLLPPELSQVFARVLTAQNKTIEEISNYGLSLSEKIPDLQKVMDELQTVWSTQYPLEPPSPNQAALFAKAMQKLLAGCDLNAASLPHALKTTVEAWLQHPEYCLNPASSLLWTLEKPQLEFLARVFSEENQTIHQAIEFAKTKRDVLASCPKEPNDRDTWYENLEPAFQKELDVLKLMVPISILGKNASNFSTAIGVLGSDQLNMGNVPGQRILKILNAFNLSSVGNIQDFKPFLNYLSKEVPAAICFLPEATSITTPEEYQQRKELAKIIVKNQGDCLVFLNQHFDFAQEGRLSDYKEIAKVAVQQNPRAFEHVHKKLDLENAQEKEIHLELAKLACHARKDAFNTVTASLNLSTTQGLESFAKYAYAAIEFKPFNFNWATNKLNLDNNDHHQRFIELAKHTLKASKGFYFGSTIHPLNTETDEHLETYQKFGELALTYKDATVRLILNSSKINLENPKHFTVFKNLAGNAIKRHEFRLDALNKLDFSKPDHFELYRELAEQALQRNGLLLEDANYKFNLNKEEELNAFTRLAKTAIKQNPAAMGAVFLKFSEYTDINIDALPNNLKEAYQQIEALLPQTEATSIPKNEPYAFRYARSIISLSTNRHHFDAYRTVAQAIHEANHSFDNYLQAFQLCNERFGVHANHLELVERLGAFLATNKQPYAVKKILDALKTSLNTNDRGQKEILKRIAEWQT